MPVISPPRGPSGRAPCENLFMATKEDLESLDLIRLALLCQSVADSESIDSSAAREALALRQEWALLVASETLPLSSFSVVREARGDSE